MFGIGMAELLVILVLALIFIGPNKLPELARALGRGMREFRSASDSLAQALDPKEDPTATDIRIDSGGDQKFTVANSGSEDSGVKSGQITDETVVKPPQDRLDG